MKRKLLLFICFDLALLGVAAVLLVDDEPPARPVVPEWPAHVAKQREYARAPQPEVVRPRQPVVPAIVDPAVEEADVEQRLMAAREESNWPVVKELNARLKQLRREREARERAANLIQPYTLELEPTDEEVWHGANGRPRVVELPARNQSNNPPTLDIRSEEPIRITILRKLDR
jgi:hypothetical protein